MPAASLDGMSRLFRRNSRPRSRLRAGPSVFLEEGPDERSDRPDGRQGAEMSHMDRRPADYTGEAAVGDVASGSLFGELLSRIDDKTDQVLLLARVGLEYSERNLSQALNMEKSAVDARIQEIISFLREDQALAAKLE